MVGHCGRQASEPLSRRAVESSSHRVVELTSLQAVEPSRRGAFGPSRQPSSFQDLEFWSAHHLQGGLLKPCPTCKWCAWTWDGFKQSDLQEARSFSWGGAHAVRMSIAPQLDRDGPGDPATRRGPLSQCTQYSWARTLVR